MADRGGDEAEVHREVGRRERPAVDLGLGEFDVVAQVRERLGGVLRGAHALGIDGRADGRARRDADAETARVAPDLRPQSAPRGAGVRPGRRVRVRRRRPSRAAASRTVRVTARLAAAPCHSSPSSGPCGTRPRVGLSPNRPQKLAGNADRAAAVRGVRHRHDARRDGCGRAARRAAGVSVRRPRVARRPERLAARSTPIRPNSGVVGLAEQDEPGVAAARDERRVVVGDVVAERGRPAPKRHALDGVDEVLDRVRHAAERTVRRLRQARQHARLGLDVDERADGRIARPEARIRGFRRRTGRALALPDAGGEGGGVEVVVVGHGGAGARLAKLDAALPRRRGAHAVLRASVQHRGAHYSPSTIRPPSIISRAF